MTGKRPKILIVALESWPTTARLAKPLHKAGFEVAALCHRDSFLASTQYLDQLFPYNSRRNGNSISRQVAKTIQDWNPRIVVPGDERSILLFQRMVQLHESGKRLLPPGVLDTLRFSFGNFNWQAEATSKRLTLQRAKELEVNTPRFGNVHSVAEAISQAHEFGWPVVLKKSTSSGGGGVTFCENERQLAATYDKYNEAGHWKGILKSYYLQARGWSLGRAWCPADQSFTVNEAIYGRPAAIGVVAVGGKILSHVAALKVKLYPDNKGPSSVMQFLDHPGMLQTAEKLAGYWGATGFLGFCFMVTDDGIAYLLECNARPIPLSYMGGLLGGDLCLALCQYLEGREIPAPSAPPHEFVAHFPSEWKRDPESPYLREAHHDVPWDDPSLFRKLVAEFR